MKGRHLLVDFTECECDAALLKTVDTLATTLPIMVVNAGLTVVSTHFHQFQPVGVTGVVLLAESHVCLHTWPAQRMITLDVYVCNHTVDKSTQAKQLVDELATYFQAKNVLVKNVDRSAIPDK